MVWLGKLLTNSQGLGKVKKILQTFLLKGNNCDKNQENIWGRNNDKSF